MPLAGLLLLTDPLDFNLGQVMPLRMADFFVALLDAADYDAVLEQVDGLIAEPFERALLVDLVCPFADSKGVPLFFGAWSAEVPRTCVHKSGNSLAAECYSNTGVATA